MDQFQRLCSCILVLAGVLLTVSAQDGTASGQGNFFGDPTPCNTTAVNGTITLPTTLTAGQCIITVNATGTTDFKYNTLHFTAVNLKNSDRLLIYDGDVNVPGNLVQNVTGMLDPYTVVVSQKVVHIVVDVAVNNSGSVLQATYNTTACEIEQTLSSATYVRSPVYLKNKVAFTCNYTITKSGDASTLMGLSFLKVALTNATLQVSSANQTVSVTGTNLPPDVYSDEVKMVLSVEKANVSDMFSAALAPITSSPDCGKAVNVNGSKTISITVPDRHSLSYDCRITLSAVTGKSLSLNITSLQLTGNGDNLLITDGPALASGRQLASMAGTASGYLVLSSQKQVLLRLVLGETAGPRSLTINVNELATVNHWYDTGSFALSPSSGNVAVPQYYMLEASANSKVKVNLAAEQANQTYSYTISVYDGPLTSSPLMVAFSGATRVPVLSSGNVVLVVAQLANTSAPLNVSFTSVQSGYDQVTSASKGSFTLMTSPSVPSKCTWTVTAPSTSKGTIMMDFPMIQLEKKATLSVYSGVVGYGSLVAQLTASNLQSTVPLPSVVVPAAQWAQIVFSTGNSTNFTSLAVQVRFHTMDTLCGGDIKDSYGHLRSPNFPNQYPLNAACTWNFPSTNQSQVLFFDFPQFQLAQNHSLKVTEQSNGTSREVAAFMGTADLPDFVYASNKNKQLTFSAMDPAGVVGSNQVNQGFDMQYWVLKCGGSNNNQSKGSFSSPGYPALNGTTSSTLCVWSITVPATSGQSVNIVSMTLQLKKKGSPSVTEIVKVYDGTTVRKEMIMLNTSQGDTMNVLSRYNAVIIVFNATGVTPANTIALNVTYTTYSCDQKHQCKNGICMHPDWMCDGKDDCGDNTDEQNCISPPAPTNPPKEGIKAGIVVLLFFVGLLLGVVVAVVIPRIIRRFRTNRYTAFHNDPVA